MCCSGSCIPAGQSCWHSRLKVSGGHGDGQSYSVLFHPKFQGSLWGLSHVSDLMAFQKLPQLCVWVLVQSAMIGYWQSTRTDWKTTNSHCPNILTSISHQLGESMDVNAQLCEARWKETGVWVLHSGIVVQGKGPVFIVEECVSFPENIPRILEEYSILHHSGRAAVFL